MAARSGLMGWRHPRPNDFQGSDLRPLRDTFGDLQKFMTWPHFTATIDSGQSAFSGGFAQRAISNGDDQFSIVRSASDDFVVPSEFDTWMMYLRAHVFIEDAGAGLYQVGFALNGTNVNDMIADSYFGGGTPFRVNWSGWKPARKGEVYQVRTSCPAAANMFAAGYLFGFFLPLA